MFAGKIKRILGIQDLQEELEELRKQVDDLEGHTQSIQKDVDKIDDRVEDNTQRLRELEPITVDLTNRQREALEVFLSTDSEWIDVYDIAEELDTSRTNAGSIVSDLKKKIEFDIKTVENGKKLYQLPETEQNKIFSNSKV